MPWLAVVLACAAALRFYGLGWGAPYFHFHIDEHFVFVGAERLRVSMRAAAMSGKFFMYGPVPMHLLNAVVWVHDRLWSPLVLSRFHDQVVYTILGRTISAAMSTLTVYLVYVIGKHVSGRTAGLIAASLGACAVVDIAESHTFRVDVAMVLFSTLAWFFAIRIVERGRWADYLWGGASAGAAIGAKFSGAFVVGVLLLAHALATGRPQGWRPREWALWLLKGVSPLVVTTVVFVAVNPMAILYSTKFIDDLRQQVFDPLSGATRPIWAAQFTDVQPQLYWLTNLWWGLGPAFEVCALAGLAILLMRRTRVASVAVAFPALYMLAAGGTIAPFSRYTMPLVAPCAVAAGTFSAFLLKHASWRRLGQITTGIAVGSTAAYGLSYMEVYRAPDARLEASRYLEQNVPADAHILVEPSHGIPPMGIYLRNPDFYGDHVLWGASRQRHDHYWLYTLDTYVYLYSRRASQNEKRGYIRERLELADYIVMDDFYLQLYDHLPNTEHAAVKEYYRDLFSGALGFELKKTFKVYPRILGLTINDDGAELSSRMNDHPRVYIFERKGSHHFGPQQDAENGVVMNASRL